MTNHGLTPPPSYRTLLKSRQKKHHFLRNGVVLVALALFATAGALAVVKPTDEPITFTSQTALSLPNPFPAPLGTASNQQTEAPYIAQTQIREGDTLAALLERLEVSEDGLQAFLTHDKAARSIYKLYPGRTVQAGLDSNGDLVWLRYIHTPSAKDEDGNPAAKWLEIAPDADKGFVAHERVQTASAHTRAAEGTIASSLFGATDKAGIPDAITMQMADILASKIDFMKDLRQGDDFRIIYETHSHNGQDSSAGRILAVEFKNGSKTHRAVWFNPSDGPAGYYDFDGRSLKGAFLKTALKFTRISSKFGMRKHPIHGKWTGHKGVDYAAPSGTPIHATADGTIEFVGQQRGYGNVVIIKHHNQYSTLYAHQSRFVKGLKKGMKVAQGDQIGYVGATGWATGPHLHYEFRVNGKPVDPLSVDLPVARALEGADKQAFDKQLARYQDHMQLIARLQDEGMALASSQ